MNGFSILVNMFTNLGNFYLKFGDIIDDLYVEVGGLVFVDTFYLLEMINKKATIIVSFDYNSCLYVLLLIRSYFLTKFKSWKSKLKSVIGEKASIVKLVALLFSFNWNLTNASASKLRSSHLIT